jgi:hypothetical protein
MQMGMGLLAAGGPSRTPVSFGQSLGQAGMQGMQAFQQANVANRQAQLAQLQMDEAMRAGDERKRKDAAVEQFKQQFPHLAQMADVDLRAAVSRAFPEQKKPQYMEVSGNLVRTDTETPTVALTLPGQVKPQSDLGKLESDYKSGLVTPEDYKAKKAKLTAPPSPLVTVDNRQEGEFGKIVGRELGEQYGAILKADMNAPTSIAKYQRLGNLLSNVNTGKFKGTITDMKAAAKSLGFDLTSLGISDDVAPAQAARALSNQIALELRNPAGGAGMPGALSDKDREFLIQSIPGLENDPGAVGKMVEYRVKLEQRAQKVARMARDYRRKNGKFDEGFYDELAQWSEKNPLFANEAPAAPKPGANRIRFDANGNPI